MVYGRIRDMREDHDMTQREIAQFLGITQSVYSKYEAGSVTIPATTIDKLADLYKTSADYLMGRTNIKKPYPKNRSRPPIGG